MYILTYTHVTLVTVKDLLRFAKSTYQADYEEEHTHQSANNLSHENLSEEKVRVRA